MFRQRGSGYGRSGHRRRAGRPRWWAVWLAVLAGCGTVALGLHLATSPRNLDATSAANVFRAGLGSTRTGAPVFYDEAVQPGDSMSASVTAGSGSTFTLTLTDATRNWTRTVAQAVPGAERASAEIIAEAPSSQGVLPLADFGTVHFSDATVDGQPAGDDQPVALTLVSGNGTAEATPSPLTSGASFTVTWSSSGTAATQTAAGSGAAGSSTSGTSPAGHRHHHRKQDQG
jgi:hypothetical protein